MTHPFVTRIQIDVFKDADLLDRKNITGWLMQWSTSNGVDLEDFRGGRIRLSGIEFFGSAVIVYDQFISDLLFDFEDRWVRYVEDSLAGLPTAEVADVAAQCAGMIQAARDKMLRRATDIKARMSKDPGARVHLLPRDVGSPKARLCAAAAVTVARTQMPKGRGPLKTYFSENKGPIVGILAFASLIVAIAGFLARFFGV